MKKLTAFLIILLTTTSCISSREIIKNSKHKATTFSSESISGTYKNDTGLWTELRTTYKLNSHGKNVLPENTQVTLEFLTREQLKVTLKTEKELIDPFILKGKMKGDYFSIRRKFSLIPFFPILYLRDEYKLLLANNSEGNLIVLKGEAREGMLLVIGAGRKWNHSKEYIKL